MNWLTAHWWFRSETYLKSSEASSKDKQVVLAITAGKLYIHCTGIFYAAILLKSTSLLHHCLS